MFTSIMVGQDASEYSEQALRLSAWIAESTQARLNLIYLHQRKPRTKIRIEEMEALMDERLADCRRASLRCSWRVVQGWSTQTLVNEAKWYDLVAVGKSGVNAASHRGGLGTLATALLSSSPVPVLLVDPHPGVPKELLVVFDDSPDACTALRFATALASERDLRLHVVDAAGGRGRAGRLERAAEYVGDWDDVEAEFESLTGRPAESVPSFIEKRGVRLSFLPALDRSLSGHKLANNIASRTRSSLAIPRGHTPPVY